MEQVHPLRQYREQQDPPLTQDQLAALLGVTKGTISRWEAGSRQIDVEKLPDVAQKTGIPRAKLRPDLANVMNEADE